MIDIQVRIVYAGEKFDVTDIKASDLVALERQFSVSIPHLGDALSFEQACFLVWRDLRRRAVIAATVPFNDDFLDQIDDMEDIPDPFDPPADPPSPDSSP